MKEDRPNIILIVCDTLSAKHMSLYGYHRKTTPNLERLVEEKGFVVYNNCYSTSCWTPPAHASIFTGLYPQEHGVHELNYCLSDNLITLPEVLKMMGYYTVGISCNGLIGVPTNFNKGFDVFIELEKWTLFKGNVTEFKQIRNYISNRKNCLAKTMGICSWAVKNRSFFKAFQYLINSIYNEIKGNSGWFGVIKNSTRYTLKALKIAQLYKSKNYKPLFIFINLMQTHHRYNPPKPYRHKWSNPKSPYKNHNQNYCDHYFKKPFPDELINYLRDLYDEEVLFLDTVLYEFYIKTIDEEDMVIITADHGEHFGENGHLGHILSLHDAVVKVPLLIKYPFGHKCKLDSKLVQINDIYATLMELVRCPMPIPLSSKSLLSCDRREKAYMQIVHPEGWLSRVKDNKFKNEKFVRIINGS